MGFLNIALVVAITIGLVGKNLSAPIDVDSPEGQQAWLSHYSYSESQRPNYGTATIRASDSFAKAVRMFQRFLNLPETGIVDDRTKEFMKKARCGMQDNVRAIGRKRRYVLQGSQFPPGSTLTYRINVYSRRLDERLQDQIFSDAFNFWSSVANIQFLQVTDPRYAVNIDIKFATGNHGDHANFDGKGGILAHAFFPNYEADQHYDEDELWAHQSNYGPILLQTVTHEIGHSLGLKHTPLGNKSVMNPYIYPYDPDFGLEDDDIRGIQALYGPSPLLSSSTERPTSPSKRTTASTIPTTTTTPKTTTTTATTTTASPTTTTSTITTSATTSTKPPQVDSGNICYDGSIDAVTLTEDNSTYIFRGSLVYKIDDLGVAPGYPVSIGDPYRGFYPMSGKIDAALFYPTDGTYLFQGDSVSKFRNRRFIGVWRIDEIVQLPPSARPPDAVFYWPYTRNTYITKGHLYWKFDIHTGNLDSGYPRSMSTWGLPLGVDAAFQYTNGQIYFFKGGQYYKFDDSTLQIAYKYPRQINYHWFDCKTARATFEYLTPEELH